MSYIFADSVPEHIRAQTQKHPCYTAGAQHARLHLPVAPQCNIQCNYCNRKFDCLNESRPGVTSEVLTPPQAKEKFSWVKEQIPQLSVVGIAGPGDALANWQHTKQTIAAIKLADPGMVFCLSTNGLLLSDYAPEIISLGLNHITVTVNTIDPGIGAQIYQFVRYRGKKYEGVEAARLLMQNQLAGIAYLAAHGVLVKVNIVMIKGINDQNIPAVVQTVKDLGAFVANIMPLIPAPGSAFAHFPQTSMKEINEMRALCQIDLPQMQHCKQCRADAVGLLHEDRAREFRFCNRHGTEEPPATPEQKLYKIAVASKHGKLVDQHFGHAAKFLIYQGDGRKFHVSEERQVEKYCAGMEACDTEEMKRDDIINALQDCDAILTMRIGYHAKERLRKKGIYSVEYCDTVENGLRYTVSQLAAKEAVAKS